jgi:uncharacterized protein (DUF4415 family)
VRITYDPAKREQTLVERSLDFEDAKFVFAGRPSKSMTFARTMASVVSSASGCSAAGSSWWATRRVVRFATSSACVRPTPVNKPVSRRTLKSDLARVDAHRIARAEYEELPELTEEMLARAVVNKGGRPRSAAPRQLISLRLPPEVIARWRATGPGWQTRMAERLSKAKPT